MGDVTTFLTDLAMGESARWHDGRFWCSDWVAGEILAAGLDGTVEVVARSTSFPFCFDWLPDGTLVVTGATGLERLERDGSAAGSLVPHVDMTALADHGWNEVVVDPRGNAYVNSPNFDMSGGFDFEVGSTSGVVALVTPDGEARLVAEGVAFPNGMAVTPDGSTLLVAESFASRLSAWDIGPDGSLSNRRVWAPLEDCVDGICVDAEGAVWCATQTGCARVREGGEVAQRVPLDLFGSRARSAGPTVGPCSWWPTSGPASRTSARGPVRATCTRSRSGCPPRRGPSPSSRFPAAQPPPIASAARRSISSGETSSTWEATFQR